MMKQPAPDHPGGSARPTSHEKVPPRSRSGRTRWTAFRRLYLRLAIAGLLFSFPGCNLLTDEATNLTVNTEGEDGASGTVVSQPSGIHCGRVCVVAFHFGITVTLVAIPDPGSVFLGWSGACSGGGGECSVNMTTPRTVNALFGPASALTVAKEGSGTGRVISNPTGIFCGDDCQLDFSVNETVTLTAEPTDGSLFVGWSGDCSGTTYRCTLEMTEPREAVAIFQLGYFLDVTLSGEGAGSVESDPWGIECGPRCRGSFADGDMVTLTAEAAEGSVFTGWSGDCRGDSPTCFVNMTQSREVDAEFTPKRTLTFNPRGCGSGMIISSPPGVECTDTCSVELPQGKTLSLFAEGTHGAGFAGWSGACSGWDEMCTLEMTEDLVVEGFFSSVGSGIWTTVVAGRDHSCGLTTTNEAYCWGDGSDGRLGNGSTADQMAPVPVAGGHEWTQVVAGGHHSCGITTTGTAYCWGRGSFGRLGNNNLSNQTEPVPVEGGHQWSFLTLGLSHTCGITTTGEAYCWGLNNNGRLGNDSTDPEHVLTPSPVAGQHQWAHISAGYWHTCGITTAGDAYCWGVHDWGQLGHGGARTSAPDSVPVAVAGQHQWAHAHAGYHHTCGMTTTGEAYCWGRSRDGQGGYGSTSPQLAPGPVDGGRAWSLVRTGDNHTCGITAAGEAFCWGNGGSGQLGDGDDGNALTPVAVAGRLDWAHIAPGSAHTCGVSSGGVAYCWGSGDDGKLGTGEDVQQLEPARVVNP